MNDKRASTIGFPRRLAVAATATVLVLLGQPQPASAASPAIRWTTCPTFGGASAPDSLECGLLSVPLDYKRPDGEKIDIAVSRLKARRPDARRGVLLLNPGGPGGAGMDMPLWMSELMPQSVLDRFDLIGFDPRGVSLSAPVSCGLSLEKSYEIAPPMEQPGGFDATAAFMQQAAQGCGHMSGPRLPHMTTANTARDMDQVRQALGEAKISYFGYSYGTYLGAVYSTLFPTRTDRIVLDSSTDSRANWRETFRRFGIADDSRFPDFARFVIANPGYGLGTTQAEVRDTFFQLVSQMDQHPLPMPDAGILLDGPWFRALTFSGLYSDGYFKDTALLWKSLKAQAGSGVLQPLVSALKRDAATAYPTVPEDNSGASTNAVVCDDAAWPRSVEQYRQELNADSALYPMFGVIGSHIWPCAFWPNQPLEPATTINANGPSNILIVQNRRDPATPYPYALDMRAALGQRSRMVLVEQGGHGASYGEHNKCAKSTVTNFLVAGTFPSADTTCPAETEKSLTAAEEAAMKTLRHRMMLMAR